MCGIAGYLGPRALPQDHIDACLALMGRRGPDARGLYQAVTPDGRHVALLHSRLSIIDLDPRSNQPFKEGESTIVFNGELYNYVELREQLRRGGETFVTDSDTEVLVKLLQSRGREGLDACEGMWAFACFDAATGRLLLSRDRFGEKPLYYCQREDGFYLGSEAKFVMALMGRRLPINVPHLYRYLVNGYKSLYKTPGTFFDGLAELPAGTVMAADAQPPQIQRYWNVRVDEDPTLSWDEAVAGVRERLIDAVRLRLRADVPLAFCMSGGIDSNSLIAIAKQVFQYDVHGFTIVNDDARYEEQAEVEHVVKEVKLRHTAVPIERGDFLEQLRTLVRQHDAPVSTISYFAHWTLMKQIHAAGYRISISGTAADELFTGYYDHHLFYLAMMSAADRRLYESAKDQWQQHVRPVVRNPYLNDPERFIRDPSFREHIFLNQRELTAYLTRDWHEEFREEDYGRCLLRNRMLNEMFHEIVPVILHEDDLNAMYYSIENRSPYLDRRLFEFAYRIPTRYLVRDGRAKAVLRAAMRGIVPDRILENRRKVGFNAPIRAYLDCDDPATRRRILEDSPIYDHVRRERIVQLLEKQELPNSESKFLFYFLNCKMFLEEFAA